MDYNIEYAHIYADDKFGVEQMEGIKTLRYVIQKMKKLKRSYVLSVLIDDYNPTYYFLDTKNFLIKLKKLNAEPDFVFFESSLVPCYKDFLQEIKPKLRREYIKYIESHKKVPCSLLIAIWHLKRLGVIDAAKEEIKYINHNIPQRFVAKKIITILPKKYEEVENMGLKIIANTRFKDRLTDIVNIFF